jgi:hypothetical protein
MSATVKYQINDDTYVLIDEEDVAHVERYKWSPRVHERTTYAQANVWRNDQRSTLVLHRFIARAQDNEHVDHRNGDGLDCRKANLRTCLKFQNNRNARVRTDNTSGYKGVSWWKHGERWTAGIMLDGKRRHIGYFPTAEDSARAYDAVAQWLWGEFAWLNFPDKKLTATDLDTRIREIFAGRTGYLADRLNAS